MSSHSKSLAAGVSDFRALVGYRTRTRGPGYAEIELEVASGHGNNIGAVHGGVFATLLDTALGTAAAWCPVPGNWRPSLTVSLSTTFLGAVSSGLMIATGRVEAQVGRLAHVTGEIRDGAGRLVATGQATFQYAPGAEGPEGIPRTPQRPTG